MLCFSVGQGPRARTLSPITLGVIAAVLALVPVLAVSIPGFSDAPAHMARHHILAMASSSTPLSHYFVVHWQWIANLGEDIPAVFLAHWLGGDLATRLVSAAIAPLTIAGILALSRAAHGRVTGSAMLATPLALNQAWMFGFLNYCLGIALALLTAAWLFSRQRERLPEQAILGIAALVVWTAHMAAWATLLLLAAANELARLRSIHDIWPAIRRNLPLMLPVIPLLIWRAHSHGANVTWIYEDVVRYKLTVFAGSLRGTWMKLDLALLGAIFLSALLALRWTGRQRQMEPRLLIAALLLAAGALAAPLYLLNSWGTDVRTAPIAIMLFVMAVRPAIDLRKERLVCLIGLSLFLVRLGSVTWAWASRSAELEHRLTMLDAVPRGGKLGYVYVRDSCDGWALTPDEKLASYAVTRRDAFVNTLFMVDNARLLTIRDPKFQERWTSDSQRVTLKCPEDRVDAVQLQERLQAMRQDHFDAIWVSGVPAGELPPVPGYRVVRHFPKQAMLVQRR